MPNKIISIQREASESNHASVKNVILDMPSSERKSNRSDLSTADMTKYNLSIRTNSDKLTKPIDEKMLREMIQLLKKKGSFFIFSFLFFLLVNCFQLKYLKCVYHD